MNGFEIVTNGGICTPLGWQASAVNADIKGNDSSKLDYAILISDFACNSAAVFTSNIVKAAPVLYDYELLSKKNKDFYGIIANSGNANACTGKTGYKNCMEIASSLERLLNLPEQSILTASTGVIGNQLPMDKMLSYIEELADNLDDDNSDAFSQAIMTTDTVAKQAAILVHTKNGTYSIGGACKGSGMIDPAMATFLGFITTDADISSDILHTCLKEAADETINCVTVDGDMSTNDSLFIFANGASEIKISSPEDIAQFKDALTYICDEFAKMLAKDGEGVKKFVTVEIKNAKNDEEAKLCASKIANSPLVKTMFAGCDPNWGRLMASAGASGASFNPDNVDIWFNDIHYVSEGVIIDSKLEKEVFSIMNNPEYSITMSLNAGSGKAKFYTCDMTEEYIKINADYRS